MAALSAAASPYTVFAVYHQWRVVKKWCTLCLITIAVLWVQLVFLLPSLIRLDLTAVGISGVTLTAFIFASAATVWLLTIKPALNRNKELADKNYSLLRFKNNPDIFSALLRQQRIVDFTPFHNDIQLGNPSASVQIMLACNPYCRPCAKAYEFLCELLGKHDIGLTIRFTVNARKKEDKKTQVVEYILQLVAEKNISYKRKALHDWYAEMHIDRFREKHLLMERLNVDNLLKQHEQWSEEAKIAFTPTVFINGYEFPKQYKPDELIGLLKRQGTEDADNETQFHNLKTIIN